MRSKLERKSSFTRVRIADLLLMPWVDCLAMEILWYVQKVLQVFLGGKECSVVLYVVL